MSDGSIHIDTKIDQGNLKPQMATMKKSLISSFASMRDVMMGPVGAAKALVGAAKQVGAAFDGLIMSAANAARANAILGSTLKATGAEAWTNKQKLNEFSDTMAALTLFEDEAISGMQGVLLGFKNIKGDNFKEASTQILNMAEVMGMDLTGAAQAVGKALDDPINGIDSLSRQGFKFTQEQKNMLKAMVQTGEIAKAQKIILDELATTYGGAAEAAASSSTGIWINFKKAYGEMLEAMGEQTATFLKDIIKWYGDGFNLIAEQINKKTREIKIESVLAPLLKKKTTKGEISKALMASGLEWSDAVDVLTKKLEKTRAEYAKLTPDFEQTAGYQEEIGPTLALLNYARDRAAEEAEIVAQKARQAKLDAEADARAAQAKKDAESQAKAEADAIDAESEARKKIIDWSYEQVEKAREDRLSADLSAIEETSDAEKKAQKELADSIEEAAAAAREAWKSSLSDISGSFSAIASGISSIGGENAQGLSNAFNLLSGIINAASQNFANVATDIEVAVSLIAMAGENLPDFMGGLLDQVFALSDGILGALDPIFQAVLITLDAIMPIFEPVIALIAELAKIVAPFIPLVAMAIRLYFDLMGVSTMIQLIIPIVQAVANIFLWLYNNVVRPVYNFLVLVLNKIFNAFATFINSLLAAVDSIPLVELPYRISLRAETEGTLGEITPGATPTTAYSQDLADANEALQENRDLFRSASKAADAYEAVLASLTGSIADFYDGLKDVGSDISSMIIDSLTSGFDNDDFLFALEEYITQSVIQAAVYTDVFLSQVSAIGTQLAQAISSGDTSAIENLKNQLSALYLTAQASAEAATAAVAGAFGSYAVGSLGLPGDGLIYAHAGEGVIPTGLMNEAMTAGLTIAPTSSIISRLGNINLTLKNHLFIDGREVAAVAFKYQDELNEAAYGT